MSKIVEINEELYIEYSENNRVLFPIIDLEKIDWNEIKRKTYLYNKKNVLSKRENITFDELISYLRTQIIRELRKNSEEN